MKKYFLVALSAMLGLAVQQAPAQAGDAYIGGEIFGASVDFEMGGHNTAGTFNNTDDVDDTLGGIALTFGMRDKFKLGGMAITPEVELAWYEDANIVSASFPGLPNPTFFYRSSVSTGRLGVNFWTPFHNSTNWRGEAGLGLGVLYHDMTTTDNVVSGSGDDYALYGKFGLRAIRSLGQRGSLTMGLNYVASGETNLALVSGGGVPAGNLSFQTQGPEISIGYQVKLGK